jgi:hypothetical protein
VKQFDFLAVCISRFEKPLPPFSRGKLNLSIADLGWCLLNLVIISGSCYGNTVGCFVNNKNNLLSDLHFTK